MPIVHGLTPYPLQATHVAGIADLSQVEAGQSGYIRAPRLLSCLSGAPSRRFYARPCPPWPGQATPPLLPRQSSLLRPRWPWVSSLWAQSWIACLAFQDVTCRELEREE